MIYKNQTMPIKIQKLLHLALKEKDPEKRIQKIDEIYAFAKKRHPQLFRVEK